MIDKTIISSDIDDKVVVVVVVVIPFLDMLIIIILIPSMLPKIGSLIHHLMTTMKMIHPLYHLIQVTATIDAREQRHHRVSFDTNVYVR